MPYIDLGDGLRAQVDADIHKAVGHLPWRAARNGRSRHVYVVCSRQDSQTGPRLRLHQVVAQMGGVPGQGPVIDHRNGDTLDNRRRNLRRCTRWENASSYRRSPGRTYLTPFIGVTLDHKGRAVAQLTYRGRCYRIGTFLDVEEAARARDRVARQLRGEYAVVNFATDDGRPLLTRVDPDRSCGKRIAVPFDMAAVLAGA